MMAWSRMRGASLLCRRRACGRRCGVLAELRRCRHLPILRRRDFAAARRPAFSSSQGLVKLGRSGRLDSRVKGRRSRGVGADSESRPGLVTNPVPTLRGLGMNFLIRGVVCGFGAVAFGGDDDGVDVVGRRCGDGEECGEFAGDVKDSAAFDCDGFELACGDERVDDVADARAGGEGGEEGLDLFLRRYDGLTEIERDECRERGGLASVGSGFDLLGEAGGGELPESGCAVGLRDGDDAEMLPEFGERRGGRRTR